MVGRCFHAESIDVDAILQFENMYKQMAKSNETNSLVDLPFSFFNTLQDENSLQTGPQIVLQW